MFFANGDLPPYPCLPRILDFEPFSNENSRPVIPFPPAQDGALPNTSKDLILDSFDSYLNGFYAP